MAVKASLQDKLAVDSQTVLFERVPRVVSRGAGLQQYGWCVQSLMSNLLIKWHSKCMSRMCGFCRALKDVSFLTVKLKCFEPIDPFSPLSHIKAWGESRFSHFQQT